MITHRRLYCFLGALLFSLTVDATAQDAGPPSSEPRTVKEYVELGLKQIDAGKHDSAIATLTEAIKVDPDHAPAYLARAHCLLHLDQLERALEDCNLAVKISPRFAPAYLNRGNVYNALKQKGKALADYTQAILFDPNSEIAFHNRGNIFGDMGEYDQAVADFGEAIRIDPRYALAYYNRGIVRYDQRQFEQAVVDYEKALEYGLDSIDVHNAIAWARATCHKRSVRDGAKALRHAKIACEKTEFKDAGILDTLAAAYAECGDFENAVLTMRKAIGLAPAHQHKSLRRCLERYRSGLTYDANP
ncbi:MAG: tetratricopeptide repeat protein [Planctomycetota bacterium]